MHKLTTPFAAAGAAFFLSAAGVLAQPALSAYQTVGASSFTMQDGTQSPKPSLGANQSWNFTLSPAAQSTVQVQGQDGTPTNPEFPTANYTYTVTQNGMSGDLFFKQSAAGVANLGYDFQGDLYTYQDPSVVIDAANAFGQSAYHTNLSSDDDGTGVYYYKDIDTVTYAGYGTLTLNGQVYPNAVLMTVNRSVEYADDASGPYDYLYNETYRYIYIPGLGYPVYTYYYAPDPTSPDEYVTYATNIVAATRPALTPIAFSVSPSPATTDARLGLPASVAQNGELTVTDALGRQVAVLPFQGRMVNVSGLPTGLYTVEVASNGKRYRSRLVKN